MKTYKKPTLKVVKISSRTLMEGSPTIGYTKTSGDNTQEVLSKEDNASWDW